MQQSLSSLLSNRTRPANPQGQRRTVKGNITVDDGMDTVEGICWRQWGGGGEASIASRFLCGKYIVLMDLIPRTLDKC